MTAPLLYSYWRSSCSYRVRIALAFKGVDYEYAAVHLRRAEQRADAFRAINPMAQVPTLVLRDGQGGATATLADSVAICEYLEETHPEPPLLPRDTLARAQTRRICQIVASSIQPLQNLGVMHALSARFGTDQEANFAWAADMIAKGFGGLERVLGETAGTYAVGDSITLADAFIVPQLYNARRFSLDLDAFPRIVDTADRASENEAFRAAHPDRQPDCPT